MRWKVNVNHSKLSECELITMKCIWDSGHEVSCFEIMEILRGVYKLDYKDTTVYTFLKKLKEKGFVNSYRRGVTWFVAAKSEDEYRKEQLANTRDFWYGGLTSGLIKELVSLNELSDEEKAAIKEIATNL